MYKNKGNQTMNKFNINVTTIWNEQCFKNIGKCWSKVPLHASYDTNTNILQTFL